MKSTKEDNLYVKTLGYEMFQNILLNFLLYLYIYKSMNMKKITCDAIDYIKKQIFPQRDLVHLLEH